MSSPTLMDSVFSPKIKSGEHPTASDDGNVKVRKPYTITKQRERWTEEEHQKFLEALKVHGRAWRRIEEHIGTKTAVQIRSHAQKFFSKLERETLLAGSSGNAEIEIPPPRPKRKPTLPYPRKASGAFLSSTPFEEENQSPSAIHTAFTHRESKAKTSLSKALPKEPGTLYASLRLFGQTVVPCKEMMGTDANQVDTSYSAVVESTGSPMSQLSGEAEQSSCTTSTSGVGHTSAPLMSRLEDTVGTTSNSQPYTCKATGDVDISSSKDLVESQNLDTSCFRSWQPDYFWPGIVPPSIPHGSNEDMNADGAFAAVSYAVVSAWQAIQGAMASANNEPKVNIVYSPMAILGAAKNPQPSHDCNHELSKNEQEGDGRDGNDTDRTNLHEEDSTAECCSSLTADTSNYECVPAKKCRGALCIVGSEASNSHIGKAGSLSLFHDVSHIETPVKKCHKCMDEATRAANIGENGLADGLPVESSLCECSAVSSPVTEQPLDLIIQAYDLDSSMETDEEKEPTIGIGSHGSDPDTGSLSAASTMRGENATNISKECVERRNRDGLQSRDHLFMMKAGSALYNRYSGVGFVPYKKRSTSFQ